MPKMTDKERQENEEFCQFLDEWAEQKIRTNGDDLFIAAYRQMTSGKGVKQIDWDS